MTPTANLRKRGDSLSEQNKSSFPTYKGKPLVRSGDTIYYGSMKDKYVIKMDIKSKKKVGGLDVADKVTVQLMYTDPEIRTRKQIVKTSAHAFLCPSTVEKPLPGREGLCVFCIGDYCSSPTISMTGESGTAMSCKVLSWSAAVHWRTEAPVGALGGYTRNIRSP